MILSLKSKGSSVKPDKTDSRTKMQIPIVIGVTGHRTIREQDYSAIYAAVKKELQRLREQYPHSPFVMLSSLAEGGDLLCADAAKELGIPLIAALPREREDYVQDFGGEGKARFDRHLAAAKQVFVVPASEAGPGSSSLRNYQFRQAGIYVAAHCHILMALWDGEPGRHGCGTAETVDFALKGSYNPASGMCLRSEDNAAVIHIFTPRGDHPGQAAGTACILGNRESVTQILERTDDFNKNAALIRSSGTSRLPEEAKSDPVLTKMDLISRAAGILSRKAAGLYRRILALLAAASALLTFAFLMYDEAGANRMILVCGAMLIAAWACQRYARRSDCHRRYIEYRALAESLRVQTYLRYAGSGIQAAGLFSWTQQEETAWILDALLALTVGETPQTGHDIRACWVEAQREYHREASGKAGAKLSTSDRIVNIALILSVGLYLSAVGYELLCGGLIFRPALTVTDVELWRTVLKILLGTISAVTLFIANYYGRLSLPRVLSDHRKMERFYASMSAQLERRGQTEELLAILAREELTENGNWSSYQRDNTPDISL